jgi:hypothetical protein
MMWACAAFALVTAAFPVARAFFRVEVDYNEGWNVYTAGALAAHQLLYPVRSGWTTVNYPMGWFAILAGLHRWTGEYLFTGRALSVVGLAGQSVLVAAIVRRLGGSPQAAWLAALLAVAVFATDADVYVGMNDPQMFALIFFLGGLLVYLGPWGRESFAGLAGAALLFVVGGSIKHSPIDFPLAVLLELLLLRPSRAAWFAGCGLGFAAISVGLNIRFGGPHFIDQMLGPRSWAASKAFADLENLLGPLLLPVCVAAGTAIALRRDRTRRIAGILLGTSLVVGGYFGGGRGVSINALFSALLAMVILLGLFFDAVAKGEWGWTRREDAARKTAKNLVPGWVGYAPVVLFGWLLIPWLLVPAIISGFAGGAWDPVHRLRATRAAERRFGAETRMLQSAPGPVLCESLLACALAGKPYVYDPFNATRMIDFGRLDVGVVVDAVRRREYGAVQFDSPMQFERGSERWDARIVAAVEENYRPLVVNEDGEIYVPKPR